MSGDAYTLTRYDRMRTAIVEARDIDEVKDIRDKAEALRQYAKQAGESLENQNMIAEIKLRAERRAGELLAEMPKAKGGQPYQEQPTGNTVKPVETTTPTLTDLGISKAQSSRWQSIASLPEEVFEAEIAKTRAEKEELTTAGLLRVAQAQRRMDRRADMHMQTWPDGVYRIIYADPPWQYEETGVTTSASYGGTRWHYPSMSIDELAALPIGALAADDCTLFLWATSPMLPAALTLINAWGFTYKTSFVWDKVLHNFGYYNSVRHELLLVAGRGSSRPDVPTLYDSVVSVERTEHSTKPEIFREMIDHLYPYGPRIELFARRESEGWDIWGNQA